MTALALGLAISACATGGGGEDAGGGSPRDGGAMDASSPSGSDAGRVDAYMPLTCAEVTCDPNAVCDANSGVPTCFCNDGFEGDGTTCTAVTEDRCPADPDKTSPGICGCGTPDADTDGDGTADCLDACPDDPTRTAPGECGCGASDTDGDGTADCLDVCPDDPTKTAAGDCGCGVPDTDADGDGTADCIDGCPSDGTKTAPGACGCGAPDTDTDGDGTPNCIDGCPSDASKTAPGTCGCGTPDTDGDGDGTPDCVDGCPSDPLKTAPGTCGCGVSESTGSTSTIAEPRTSDWTTTRYFRGNAFHATSNTTLQSFEHYLGLSGTCTVGFYVLSGSSASGPWTTIWSAARSLGAGTSYRSSGPIDVAITSGRYYGIGVGWDCAGGNYHGNSATSWVGYDAGIGTFQNSLWDNAYPGYSGGYTPPNAGTGTVAYTQRISVGGCGSP